MYTLRVSAATLTPGISGGGAGELTGDGRLPEERDEELHQIHEVTMLGEGNLLKQGTEGTGVSQKSALIEEILKQVSVIHSKK